MNQSTPRLLLWSLGLLGLVILIAGWAYAGSLVPTHPGEAAEAYDLSAYWLWWVVVCFVMFAVIDFLLLIFRRRRSGD